MHKLEDPQTIKHSRYKTKECSYRNEEFLKRALHYVHKSVGAIASLVIASGVRSSSCRNCKGSKTKKPLS